MYAKRAARAFLVAIASLAGVAVVALVGWNLIRNAVEPASALAKAPAETNAAAKPQSAKQALVAQDTSQSGAATTTTTTTTTTHGGWTVTCSEGGEPPKKACSASFRVTNKDNKAIVLIWLLGRNPEGKLLSEFVTPTDILIKPGVAVSLNESKPVRAEYLSCTASQGCRASIELTPNLIRQMKDAKKAKIGLTLLNGKVMEIAMDVPGIDLALSDLGA